MARLPDRFPTDKLGNIERIQLEWFLTRFTQEYYADYGFGHFILLAYAAVPAYLTPDLLYKLRQNFGEYHWGGEPQYIHPLAVSDILLSPFCKEVSFELYRMDENVRLSLLRWMSSDDPAWMQCKPHPIRDIARFVNQYHEAPSSDSVRHGEKYREEQHLEAQFYFDSNEVARHYLQKLEIAVEKKQDRQILDTINALLKTKSREAYIGAAQPVFQNLFGQNNLELWKIFLQQNPGALTSLLETADAKQMASGAIRSGRSTDSSKSIVINQQDTATINTLDEVVSNRKIAVFIGLSSADSANCDLMHNTLKQSHSGAWENHFVTKPMSSRELNERLHTIFSNFTRHDHLLVYISIVDAKGPARSKNKLTGIIPQAHALIETIFQKRDTGGVTVICDGLLEQAEKTISDLADGKVLFVSPQRNQPVKKAKSATSEFTTKLCEAISSLSILHTNRQLYASVVSQYNKRSLSSKNENLPVNSPIMLCNRITCGFPFSRNNSHRDTAQRGLRLLGYCDSREHTDWTGDDEYALVQFGRDVQMAPDVNTILPEINKAVEQHQKDVKPLFLFVFSDPERQLKTLETEIQYLNAALTNTTLRTSVDIKIMYNRSLAEVDQYMQHENTRNRVQLFYYSGMDNAGCPVFLDGVIDINMFAGWLGYHTNLDLVVLNTCRASPLARQLTQIGVGLAIGADDVVYDAYGTEFAEALINVILERKSFSTLPLLSIDDQLWQ